MPRRQPSGRSMRAAFSTPSTSSSRMGGAAITVEPPDRHMPLEVSSPWASTAPRRSSRGEPAAEAPPRGGGHQPVLLALHPRDDVEDAQNGDSLADACGPAELS